MKKKNYDVIVLGLGAMGSATLYQLAKKGSNVLGIDQYMPPHNYGSTHGETRIIRQAIGEGEHYISLILRAYELWREIERESGKKLLHLQGGLIISSKENANRNHVPGFFETTLQIAKTHHINHEIIAAPAMQARFSQFKIKDHELGYHEKDMGYLSPEECVKTQLELAKKNGAEIHFNEKMLSFSQKNYRIIIKTDQAEYCSEKLIISIGSWVKDLLPKTIKSYVHIYRQIFYWFDISKNYLSFLPENFPTFIWDICDKGQGVYGFPAVDGKNNGIKLATTQYQATTTVQAVNRKVSQEEINAMYGEYIEPYLQGVTGRCLRTSICLYTSTPNRDFIIDQYPDSESIYLVSPCSGHGFKFSAAIGEALADLSLTGRTMHDLSHFRLSCLTNKCSEKTPW